MHFGIGLDKTMICTDFIVKTKDLAGVELVVLFVKKKLK